MVGRMGLSLDLSARVDGRRCVGLGDWRWMSVWEAGWCWIRSVGIGVEGGRLDPLLKLALVGR
jgi:hypothetical protein